MTIDFATGAPVPGDLDVSWIHGSLDRKKPTEPPIQTHRYDQHTVILRQSKDVYYEAPFLFLLFGNDRALLLDTGAVASDAVRGVVDRLIKEWRAEHPRVEYPLVVAHTHGHGDHVAGDASFRIRPDTTVVGREPAAVRSFFGFEEWPRQVVQFDLGGRVLDITAIPGHHPASIAAYDPWTGLLFTGDNVMPARIYIQDMPVFLDGMQRLVAFTESRPVTHVLGCHIEMTRTAGKDYFPGCRYQPDEPPLQMSTRQLHDIRDAAVSVADKKGVHKFDDFIIYNGMGPATALRLSARGIAGSLRSRLHRQGV